MAPYLCEYLLALWSPLEILSLLHGLMERMGYPSEVLEESPAVGGESDGDVGGGQEIVESLQLGGVHALRRHVKGIRLRGGPVCISMV